MTVDHRPEVERRLVRAGKIAAGVFAAWVLLCGAAAAEIAMHYTTAPTGPEPPTVVVPTRRCWRWWARRPHRPHLAGAPPQTRRCPGVPTRTAPEGATPA